MEYAVIWEQRCGVLVGIVDGCEIAWITNSEKSTIVRIGDYNKYKYDVSSIAFAKILVEGIVGMYNVCLQKRLMKVVGK